MTREDIRKAFPEATDEQVKGLLDIHSADIGRAKGDAGKLQAELKAAQEALGAANATIQELEKAKGDVAAMQKQLDDYRAADEARKQAEARAQAREQLMGRMDKALNGRTFIVDELRDVVADRFDAALKDQANQGRSDADVFEAVVKDKNYFASQAPDFRMAGIGGTAGGEADYAAQMRAALGLPQK